MCQLLLCAAREGEAKAAFEELKTLYEEAAAALRHATNDYREASERADAMEEQLNATSEKHKATKSTLMADSEVQASKVIPGYAVVRAHGLKHGDPAINELKFLMEQMILQQQQTIELIRQEKDEAVAAAQREKEVAIEALRKERDAALSTLMNAQLQVEEIKSNNNPYGKVAASAYSTKSRSSGGASRASGGGGAGSDNLLSKSYLTKAAVEAFTKAAGPPIGVTRALRDFDLWKLLRKDIADYITYNTSQATAYNSAGQFIGKPIHPWLKNRAAELGITVDFLLPQHQPTHLAPKTRTKSATEATGGLPAASGDGDDENYDDFVNTAGILYAIGTRFGTAEWTNPGAAGLVTVTRSSDGKYSEPASAMVGREGAYSFTGSAEPDQWYKVDFGNKRLVWPVAYSLRHGYSSNSHYLRDWVLEGSLDEWNWTVLSKHSNDKHLNGGYATHTWDVTQACPPSGFRYLRVRQVGRNSSNSQDLYLSGFEVYGKLLNSLHKVKVEIPEAKKKKGRKNRFLPSVKH